jgi:tRNA pseudouridine55 synthase
MRRVLRERRIGHTGTLDPLATGVLPLVVGRATRLARFLSGNDKTYDAVMRLGFATDTGDREGLPIGETFAGAMPSREAIERTLGEFRGEFLQQPPAFSAKKVAGQRSYDLARRGQRRGQTVMRQSDPLAAAVRPQAVRVSRLDVTGMDGDRLSLSLTCSAGFYVRALAHDLGERLGTGAHLEALRRTAVGDLTVADALPLDAAEHDPATAAARLVPLSRMLTHLPALTLDGDSVRRAVQGRDVAGGERADAGFVRLLDEEGDLVALAEPADGGRGLLHPSVVLK